MSALNPPCCDFLLQLKAKNWSQQNVTDSRHSTAHRSQVPEGINCSHWKAEDVASQVALERDSRRARVGTAPPETLAPHGSCGMQASVYGSHSLSLHGWAL